MLKVRIPSKNDVYNLVDNFQNNPQVKIENVEKWDIHSLYTGYKHPHVDNACKASVGIAKISFSKQSFFQTQISKKSWKYFGYYCFPFMIMFFTLSTINLVLVFSLTSFSIFLQPCITVEWSLPPKSMPIWG